MKKLFLTLITLFIVLTACSKPKEEAKSINIMALKGPTAMGLVKIMNDSENDSIYNFEISAQIDEATAKLLKGEVDIVAVPANISSILYNNSKQEVQVLAINTLGVLYIVETANNINSVSDLKGKTIYATGKGATPEYALNYILSENGLEIGKDVNIEWKSESTEIVSVLTSTPDAIALLPEPFVTVSKTKNQNIRTALSLSEEWDKIQENKEEKSSLLTGVLVARKSFVQENPKLITEFLNKYKESVDFVNNNIDESSKLIEKYDIVPAPIAKKAIPFSNIVYIEGEEMKEKLSGYLNVLYSQNPKAVGGNLPQEDFYYEAN